MHITAPSRGRRRWGSLASLLFLTVLCKTSLAQTNLWPKAPACDQINGKSYAATGSDKILKIGYVGLMRGKWAKYSQGYCQVMTMWKDFFFDPITGVGNGIVLEDGSKIGLEFHMEDAAVLTASEAPKHKVLTLLPKKADYDASATKAKLTERGKHVINEKDVHVLLSNYGSGYTPYVAKAGEELGRVVLGPGAAAESVFICPSACTNEADCSAAAFGCKSPGSRRFKNLFGSFSPAGYYFRNFVSLSVMKRAKTVAFISEYSRTFTAAMRDGARSTAEDLGLKVVADIGIKPLGCPDGTTCSKPTLDTLTKLIPAGGVSDGSPIQHNLDIPGATWQDLAEPFAELAKTLDVDIVIGATYYDSCVGLIKAFGNLEYYPRSLALSACIGNPKLYDDVGKDLRWISGPTQWVKTLSGPDYTETSVNTVKHFVKETSADLPSPEQFYQAFEAKFNTGPSYQFASAMAGLYHLEGAVKIAGIDSHAALLTAMNDFSSPSFFGQIAVDKFGRNTVRSSIIVDYDEKAVTQVVAPLFAAKTEHLYPIPSADSNMRNMQCEAGMEVEGTNAFCRVGKAPASGKTWSSIGSGRPAQGQELTSQDELASALATKTEFTQAEADVLLAGVNLDTESFVRSGNSYYVPTEALAFGTRGDFCDTSCKACPASKHSAQAGSLECDICPLNTYAAEPKTIHCSPCQIGQSTAGKTAATTCTPCASGTFNDEPGQDCRPCPTGSFSLYKAGEAHGASECIVCKDLPGSFYQPASSQDKCLQCPENTENSGSDGTNLNDCVCSPGFWRPDGKAGMPCVECPDGATCTGGPQGTQPFTQYGYWTPQDRGVLQGYPFALMDEADPTSFDLPDIFFRCPNSDACRANNTCSNVHDQDSKMCMQCGPELHNILGFCMGCPGGSLLTIIEWVLVVLLWTGIQSLAKIYPTLDLLLLYAQCLSIIQGFNAPWPQRLYELTMIMSIVNFNIDAVTPACAGISWNFYKSFYFTLFLPFIFGAGHCLWVALGYLWMKTVGRRSAFGGNLQLSIFVTTQEEFRQSWMASFSNWLALLVILYNALCQNAFQAFICIEMPDGSSVLRVDPDQTCYTSDHTVMRVFAAIGILVYVVGIPVGMFYVLYRLRASNTLKDPTNLTMLGFLYTNFEPGFWYWNCALCMRRFTLVMLMIVLYALPQFQLAVGLIMAIFAICIQYFYWPYKRRALNVLDAVALVSMALYMIGGLIFTSEGLEDDQKEITTWVVLMSSVFFIAFALALWVSFVYSTWQGWVTQKHIRDYTVGAWIKATAALRLNLTQRDDFYALIGGRGQACVSTEKLEEVVSAVGLDKVLGNDAIGHLLFLLLDRDRSGAVPSEQAAENLWQGFAIDGPDDIFALNNEVNEKYFKGSFPAEKDIRMDPALVASFTEAQGIKRSDSTGSLTPSVVPSITGSFTSESGASRKKGSFVARVSSFDGGLKAGWLDEMMRRERHVEDKGCPLNHLLSEGKLRCWLNSLMEQQDIAMIMRVSLVNQWLASFFEESADFGLNSYTKEGKFYQDMGFGCPFLIDMLLCASDEEHTFCQNNIKEWFFDNQQQRELYEGGLLSDEIEYFCRPTLLHWLVNYSTSEQRKIFKDILLKVAGFHNKYSAANPPQADTNETELEAGQGVPQRRMMAVTQPFTHTPPTLPTLAQPMMPQQNTDEVSAKIVHADIGSA